MTITASVAAMTQQLRANVRAAINKRRKAVREWLDHKAELWTIAFFRWALSKRMVQYAVVEQFQTRHTPMCNVLSNAVEEAVRSNEIDADDVTNLDRFIEHALEGLEIDACNVNGLEKYITEVVEGAEIEADNVSGLDELLNETVKDTVFEMLKDYDFGADSINFHDAVHDVITKKFDEGALTEQIAEAVCKVIVERLSV